jgi:hypothetical protein
MYTGQYTFLTTKPAARRLCTLFSDFLYVLPIESVSLDLNARIYYTDGTNALYKIEESVSLVAGSVEYWDISPATVNYAAVEPSKTINRIKIYMGTEDETETLNYYPYTPTNDELRAIYYANTAGGVDVVICTGDEQRSQGNEWIDSVSPQVLESSIQNIRNYGVSNQRARTGFTFHTSHRYSTREELLALRDFDLLRTGWLYEEMDNLPKMLPILLSAPIPYAPARANLVAVPISFNFAFDEKAFDRT